MTNPESPIETNNTEIDNESSPDEREGIISAIENLTTRFPKFKALIFAFLTTSAVLAPDIGQASEKVSGTTNIEQLDSNDTQNRLKESLETLADYNFREMVKTIQTAVESTSEVPPDALYVDTIRYDNLNGLEAGYGEKLGTLPESGRNIVITSERTHGQIEKDSYEDGANSFTAGQSLFSLTELPEDSSVSEGVTVEIGGLGTSYSEALQNALEEAAHNFGILVANNDTPSNSGPVITGGTQKASSISIAKSQHVIHKYHVVSSEQIGADPNKPEFKVTVSVTSGHLQAL